MADLKLPSDVGSIDASGGPGVCNAFDRGALIGIWIVPGTPDPDALGTNGNRGSPRASSCWKISSFKALVGVRWAEDEAIRSNAVRVTLPSVPLCSVIVVEGTRVLKVHSSRRTRIYALSLRTQTDSTLRLLLLLLLCRLRILLVLPLLTLFLRALRVALRLE